MNTNERLFLEEYRKLDEELEKDLNKRPKIEGTFNNAGNKYLADLAKEFAKKKAALFEKYNIDKKKGVNGIVC